MPVPDHNQPPTQFQLGQIFYLTRSRPGPIVDADAFWAGYYMEQLDAQDVILSWERH